MAVLNHPGNAPHLEEVDLVVVGAGLAGLSAAREAVRAGLSVRVFEARDRVGGRVWNCPLPDGSAVEAGGQWIGPHQRYINALVHELGLQTVATAEDGDEIREMAGIVSRFSSDEDLWSPDETMEIGNSIARLEELAVTIDAAAPWESPEARELDQMTFHEWVRNTCTSTTGIRFWEGVIGGIWGAELFETSLLHVLVGLQAAGGQLEPMTATKGGAQQDRIVGGSQLIALRLADELGDCITLNSPTTRITQDDSGATVFGDLGAVRCRYVVVTVPPTLAARIEYSPPLSSGRDQLMQRLPLCNYTKVNVVYSRPFWREDGLSGRSSGTSGPFAMTFDNTPAGSELGILVGFIEAGEAIRFGNLPRKEKHRAVIEQLASLFGPTAVDAIEIIETDWSREAWSRGAHQSLFGPGIWTTFGPYLRRPEGRIHWAGAETAIEWLCYMDGAVSSGVRATREILTESI